MPMMELASEANGEKAISDKFITILIVYCSMFGALMGHLAAAKTQLRKDSGLLHLQQKVCLAQL